MSELEPELLSPLIRINGYNVWAWTIHISDQQNFIRTMALWHGLILNLPAHALAVAVVPGDEGVADAGAGRRLGVAVVLLAHLPAGPSLVPRG